MVAKERKIGCLLLDLRLRLLPIHIPSCFFSSVFYLADLMNTELGLGGFPRNSTGKMEEEEEEKEGGLVLQFLYVFAKTMYVVCMYVCNVCM